MSQPDINSSKAFFSPQKASVNYAQGHLLGPPISEWTFSPEMRDRLRRYEEKYPQPTVPVPAEEEEIFCSCAGVDDGSEMIECTNGTSCLYQWFHTRCIGSRYLPADHGGCPGNLLVLTSHSIDTQTRRLVLPTLHRPQDRQACRQPDLEDLVISR